MKRIHLLLALLLLAIILIPFRAQLHGLLRGGGWRQYTIAERLRQYGPAAHARLAPYFSRAHVAYPPGHLVLVGLKRESELQVYAGDDNTHTRHIRDYPILAASGGPGPKLREGDGQVPEGLYHIASLNPNSAYHLALRLDYPNAFDREMAKRNGRHKLGGDIMIHGSNASVGCLAMGDQAAERSFRDGSGYRHRQCRGDPDAAGFSHPGHAICGHCRIVAKY